jgi:hypothetical protein
MANAPVTGTEEEQSPQPEAEPPTSDQLNETPAESGSEESSQEEPLDPDSHLESFIREQGLSDEAVQDEVGTETDSSDPNPEVLAQAQRLAEAERQRERKAAELEGIKTAFSQRAQGIRSFLLGKGVPPMDVEAVVNEFNNHHAQSSTVAKSEANAEAVQAFNESMFQSAEKTFSGLKGQRDFKNMDDFMKAVAKEARKGFISEKDHKATVNNKLLAYKQSLEEKGFIPSKAPPKDNDTEGPDNRSSLEFALNAPIEEILRAKSQRLGM